MKNKDKKTILIVDDDEQVRENLVKAAEALDLEVTAAGDGPTAKALALSCDFDIAVLDKDFPYIDNHVFKNAGNKIAAILKEKNPDIKLAGLTLGQVSEFSEEFFDIKESKQTIRQKDYNTLIRTLLNPYEKNLVTIRKQYSEAERLFQESFEAYQCISILCEGYDVFTKVLNKESLGSDYAEIEHLVSPAVSRNTSHPTNMLNLEDIFNKETTGDDILREDGSVKTPYEFICEETDEFIDYVEENFSEYNNRVILLLEKIKEFRHDKNIKQFFKEVQEKDFESINKKKFYQPLVQMIRDYHANSYGILNIVKEELEHE